jgi:hypothetical protein
MRYAERICNEWLDVIDEAFGRGSVFKLFSGEPPHNCEAADPPDGKCIAEGELPLQVFRRADGARIELTEPWHFYANKAAGRGTLARSFRIYNSLHECVLQGSVSAPEDGGDLILDGQQVAAGQKISIMEFTLRSLGVERRGT